jgi:hypothetical protein
MYSRHSHVPSFKSEISQTTVWIELTYSDNHTLDLRDSGTIETVLSHIEDLWTFVIPINCSIFFNGSIAHDQSSLSSRSWKWPSVSWMDSSRCNWSQLIFSHVPWSKLSSHTPLMIKEDGADATDL